MDFIIQIIQIYTTLCCAIKKQCFWTKQPKFLIYINSNEYYINLELKKFSSNHFVQKAKNVSKSNIQCDLLYSCRGINDLHCYCFMF